MISIAKIPKYDKMDMPKSDLFIWWYRYKRSQIVMPKQYTHPNQIKDTNCIHYWRELESDNNGTPIKYKCIRCLNIVNIPKRNEQVRNYLKRKYKE